MSVTDICFIVLGYLSGSVLYARLMAKAFRHEELVSRSRDKNPGAANAFQYGGFWCGLCTLILDMLKGFIPVFCYIKCVPDFSMWGLALVMAAPVAGHVFPLFYHFNGGKGIAVTFGSMIGLLPYSSTLILFAGSFILLSTLIRVESHYYRTLAAYAATLVSLIFVRANPGLVAGFTLITAAVWMRMHASTEEKGERKVSFLWMH